MTKQWLTIRDSVVTKTAHPGLILMSESSNIIETMPAWIALWMLNIWWAITDNTYMRSNNKISFFELFLFTHITDNIISLPVYQFCGIHQNMTKLHKMPSLWEIWQRHCNGHSQNNWIPHIVWQLLLPSLWLFLSFLWQFVQTQGPLKKSMILFKNQVHI